MTEVRKGLWQNLFDGSYINVRKGSGVEAGDILYSEEGCGVVHRMGVRELFASYMFRQPAGVSKTLARHGSLDEYVDSLPAHEHQPVIDDTFNDDTVAQTFGSLDASKMRLIGIAGPARAGKDTLASYMLDNLGDDWSRSSFADPIKEMLRAIGVDCSDDKKAVVSDDYGVTPRHMMQTLGTEWGRQTIDNDIWVKAFARLNAGKCVIVPDVRFENEADLVREHGVLIHLTGRGGIEGNHASENALGFKPGDIVIDNSRDLAWLYSQVDSNAMLCRFVKEVNGD